MRLIDRFTRDEVSAFVWWPLALVCILALIVSVPLGHRAADHARSQEARLASRESVATLQPLLAAGASSADVSAAAARLVVADPRLSAVRVWNADRALVASSDRSDLPRSSEALNDSQIDQAIASGPLWDVTDRRITGGESPPMFDAYTPLSTSGATAVTQFEAPDAVLLAEVHDDWRGFRIVLLVAMMLFLGLAALSMREPWATIGSGVPFHEDAVPTHLAVMEADRAVALEQAGARAKERIAGLQQRLDESERRRLQLEGVLQQALTNRNARLWFPATGARGGPEVVVLPESDLHPPDDVSELRVRLARTAASKKPGSREPRLEREGSTR